MLVDEYSGEPESGFNVENLFRSVSPLLNQFVGSATDAFVGNLLGNRREQPTLSGTDPGGGMAALPVSVYPSGLQTANGGGIWMPLAVGGIVAVGVLLLTRR